jgi:hypothetical protein
MSINRIVQRKQRRLLGAKKMYHRQKRVFFMRDGAKAFRPTTVWLDLRPRDKSGALQGFCAMMAKLYALGRHITSAERREVV